MTCKPGETEEHRNVADLDGIKDDLFLVLADLELNRRSLMRDRTRIDGATIDGFDDTRSLLGDKSKVVLLNETNIDKTRSRARVDHGVSLDLLAIE